MAELPLDELHQQVQSLSAAHRLLAQPILRALHDNGGASTRGDVLAQVQRLVEGKISSADFEELRKRGRFGFTRLSLRNLGLIKPSDQQSGVWALTADGARYAASRAKEPIVIEPFTLAPRASDGEQDDGEEPSEHLLAHTETYYFVPLLDAMLSGVSQRSEVLSAVEKRVSQHFTPGDRRSHVSGVVVWQSRANWALSNLRAKGFTEAAGAGQWRITDAGRKYLEAERDAWLALEAKVPTSKARVTIPGGTRENVLPAEATHTPISALEGLRSRLGAKLVDAVLARIRPEVGPTPSKEHSTKRNLILYGPPGTGKTHVARALATAITGDHDGGDDDQFRLVQFHPSYSYEDFIQGLRPDLSVTELRYKREEGPFLSIARAAEEDPESFFVLVIDEINRGDPARIFGELLFALEYRDEPVTLPQGGTLSVPTNLIIIGTMNSVDRSVALVDYALRRRFSFIRIDPDPEVIERVHPSTLLGRAGPGVLQAFNAWLTQHRDRDHALGHSYFLNVAAPDHPGVFDSIWELDVLPLLEEYFFGEADLLEKARVQWQSIVKSSLAKADGK